MLHFVGGFITSLGFFLFSLKILLEAYTRYYTIIKRQSIINSGFMCFQLR